MLLEVIKAFSNDPDERTAADYIRMRAARAWYGPSISFSGNLGDGRRTNRS
jgi:outer membrane protein TolC